MLDQKIIDAARSIFPEATDEEITSGYEEIKNKIIQETGEEPTADTIIQAVSQIGPGVKDHFQAQQSKLKMPGIGDYERAKKDYSNKLSSLQMKRMGDDARAGVRDLYSDNGTHRKDLQAQWNVEDQNIKDMTVGSIKDKSDIIKNQQAFDINSSSEGRAQDKEQRLADTYGIELAEDKELKDPESEKNTRLRNVLQQVLQNRGGDPKSLDGMNGAEMADVLALSKEEFTMALDKSQEERLSNAAARTIKEDERVDASNAMLKDPNSAVSKIVRDGMKDSGLQVPDDFSAEQAKLMGFDIDKLLTYRKDVLKAQKDANKLTDQEKTDMKLTKEIQSASAKEDIKQIPKLQNEVNSIRKSLGDLVRTKELFADAWTGVVQGNLPGPGTFDAETQAWEIQNKQVVAALRKMNPVPGSQSDVELQMLVESAPTRGTDDGTANDWYDDAINLMTRMADERIADIDRGAANIQRFDTGYVKPNFNQAVKVSNQQEYDDLEIGTEFIGDDGKKRIKQ